MFAAIVGQSWADDVHPFNLEINGIDRIASVPMESVRIEMAGPGTNGSFTCQIEDRGNTAVIPLEWDEVRFIEHAATRPVPFGGFVQSARIVPWAADGRTITLDCVGYGTLLDRKVVESFNTTAYASDDWVSLVGRHGGRVSALATRAIELTYPDARDSYVTDPTRGIVGTHDWASTGAQPDITVPVTLRSVLDQWSDQTSDIAYFYVEGRSYPWPSTGAIYWVDGCAQLHAHPQLNTDLAAANCIYDGDAPVAISESTGAGLVQGEWEYERENSDRLSGAYVIGGNAGGTGWVRRPGLERAGDLEAIVNQPESTTATRLAGYGDGAIATTADATARASFAFVSTTPVDVRPGQRILASSTALGLSSTAFRITGVSIEFLGGSVRRYRLALGSRLSQPSAMRRSGRFAYLPR